MTPPNENILAGRSLDHARALARKAWEAELEARDVMAVRSSAIAKIKRHIGRGAKADLPKLAPEEHGAVIEDMEHLKGMFPKLRLGEGPLRERVRRWVRLRDTGRGKRGVGRSEERPGLAAPAFVLLNWRKENGLRVTANRDGVAQDEGVAWGEEGERLYRPSEAVAWLAEELCLLDPSLTTAGKDGRRPDWDLAYRIVQRWREWRGLCQPSSKPRRPSSKVPSSVSKSWAASAAMPYLAYSSCRSAMPSYSTSSCEPLIAATLSPARARPGRGHR